MREIKKTIARISLLQGIRYARNLLMILLVIDFVQRTIYHYPQTGVYILLINAVMPFVMGLVLKDYLKEAKEPPLPLLRKEARYEKTEYYAHLVTAVLTILTLWLWQRKTAMAKIPVWQIKEGPKVFMAVYMGTIVACFCYFLREYPKKLNNNKL